MAASKSLVLSHPQMLAEFVRESDLKGFFEKRFASPPDLAALLFRNGELIDTFKGAHFATGGLMTALKGTVGGSTHVAIMLADLKPFKAEFAVQGISKDNIEITGVATLEIQLDPDKPSNILGLMRGVSRGNVEPTKDGGPVPGRKALVEQDVIDRIAPHFADRVIEAVIGKMNAEEIRGDVGLQDKIQADMMQEAERICGDIGIMVRAASVQWAMNEVEVEKFERARIERQQQAYDLQLQLLKREFERNLEATELQITSTVDVEKLKHASEAELSHMVLDGEIAFIDAREEATRRQEMELLAHEMEVLATERRFKMENDLLKASHHIDLAKEQERLRKLVRETEALDARHADEMRKSGAFTDNEIFDRQTRMKQDLDHRQKLLDHEIMVKTGDYSLGNLAKMNEIKRKQEEAEAKLRMEEAKAESDRRIAEQKAKDDAAAKRFDQVAKLTPEQIMTANAGLSVEMATALADKVNATEGDTSQVLTEMLKNAKEEKESDRAFSLEMIKTALAGATGIAQGASGKAEDAGQSLTSSGEIECPGCGRTVPVKSRFCMGCKHQLRT